MEKRIKNSIVTFIWVIQYSFYVECSKKSLLNEPKCSKVALNKPFINDIQLDGGGRVYIPFSLKMKGEFILRLGTDLDVTENVEKTPCYFIRIEEHKRYKGGIQHANGEETLLEAFSGINAKYAAPITDFKGYFVRIHSRARYTSIALYPAGNEEADPIILIRDEKRSHIRKINSLTMHADSPESLIKVDCKSKLNQKCSFSTDCIVSNSICESSRQGDPKCVCAVATKQEGPSTCTPFEVKIGDKCENSLICHTINAKCRKNYTTNSEEKTCQCFRKQIVTVDGMCMDAPGELDWERLYRKHPTYEDIYPGKLPVEDDGLPLTVKEGPCHGEIEIDHDTSRTLYIPYMKIGFDMKYVMSEPLDGTIKFLFYTWKERVTASLTLSNKGSNILKFGKGTKFIKNYSGELTNTIFFRVENEAGKSMGFNDGTSMFNVTKKKIKDIMELPTDVGISSDFPTRIKVFCD
ncbi:uncharacterized protein [Lepeophtheirus salmonis]|uniref:uncharacterized protein isoform X2 n=1 Tax=Lepeophtheirus salmonis TaxID=72036 RepID=UPI001AEB8D8C|nr:uncharacterized protein LOC121117396 isoform X2 [Lepeophtheirus salmonis]